MKKGIIWLLPSIIATLILILSICLKPKKAKADYLAPQPFTEINENYDKYWQYYKTGINPTNNQFNRAYIDYYFGTNYGYYTFDLSSDNPKINTIICSIILDELNDDRFIDADSKKVLECGFISGDIINNQSILDDTVLPYYINLNEYQESYVGYIDISDLDLYLEGYTYFVCRVSDSYLDNNGIGNAPQFLFWDLDITQTILGADDETIAFIKDEYYYRGRSDGWAAGNEYGYDMGYQDAKNIYQNSTTAYAAGVNDGVNSNSMKIGQTIASIFTGLGQFLNINVFGGITIGGIMLLPVIFGALWVVLKILRG